jgi:hypothetical protein
MYFIQHCFICRPSDSTVSEDAGISIYCGQLANPLYALFDILFLFIGVETASYLCSICQSSYTNKGNFKQHLEKHIKNGELTPFVDMAPAPTTPPPCVVMPPLKGKLTRVKINRGPNN